MDDLSTAIDYLNTGGVAASEPAPQQIANGPTIFDPQLNATRLVTQQDVDRALVMERAYDLIRQRLAQMEEDHRGFAKEIAEVK